MFEEIQPEPRALRSDADSKTRTLGLSDTGFWRVCKKENLKGRRSLMLDSEHPVPLES